MMLNVGSGHRIWYEQKGSGVDVLVLHGGPGSGTVPGHYALFDLTRFRVTRFDQRGCGQSRPRASDTGEALHANTTQHLISDIEALRHHLGIDSWVVFGGSWGTTLAMAYAQAHPERVSALVLAGVATTTPDELNWLYGHIGNIFPEAYAAFCAQVPDISQHPEAAVQRIAAYHEKLTDPSSAQAAADAWCTWETAIFGGSIHAQGSRFADAAFRLGFARIVTHYFSQGAFLDPDQIRRSLHRIAHIPCDMIHSRFDPSCPLRVPWQLAQNWPKAKLHILDGNTHSALDDEMRDTVRRITDGLEM